MNNIETQLAYQQDQLDKLASQISRNSYPKHIELDDPHRDIKQAILDGKEIVYMRPDDCCWKVWHFGRMGHPDFNSDIKFKFRN